MKRVAQDDAAARGDVAAAVDMARAGGSGGRTGGSGGSSGGLAGSVGTVDARRADAAPVDAPIRDAAPSEPARDVAITEPARDLAAPAMERPRDMLAPDVTASGKRVLLVHGLDSMMNVRSGDTAMKTRLEGRGMTVTMATASAVTTADATGKDLIVVAESSPSGEVNTKFTSVTVPVLSLECGIFDDLGMTGPTNLTDYGTTGMQTQIEITMGSHPLAAGLSGAVTVSTDMQSVCWGVPNANAVKVANVVGMATHAAIFSYGMGAAMVNRNAPAKRVGWFATTSMASRLTADGLKLFDAAVDWALAR